MIRTLFACRGAAYYLLITLVLYVPVPFIIPDDYQWGRWGVWSLGWTAAFAVQWFDAWYRSTW